MREKRLGLERVSGMRRHPLPGSIGHAGFVFQSIESTLRSFRVGGQYSPLNGPTIPSVIQPP